MQAGRLDRRVLFQRRTVTQLPSGEPLETWVDVGSYWASIAPLSGEERWSAPQLAAREQVEIRVRWTQGLADLSPLERAVYPQPSGSPAKISERAIYDILAVSEIGRRDGLRIIAVRRVDGRHDD